MNRFVQHVEEQWDTVDRPATWRSWTGDLLTLAIAVSGAFVWPIIGDFPLADVILIPILPCLLVAYPQRLRQSKTAPLVVLLLAWLTSQIATDAWRATAPWDWIRADARICIWAIDLVTLSIVIGRNVRRHILFVLGFACGLFLEVHWQPTEYTDFWKFGYSGPVTSVALLVSSLLFRSRFFLGTIAVLIGLSILHLMLGYRAGFLFSIASASLVLGVMLSNRGFRIRKSNGVMRQVAMGLMGSLMAAAVVLVLAQHGILGEQASAKNALQSAARGGILLGGRPELLISTIAVLDSPILGHGAWARDQHYVDLYRDLEAQYDVPLGAERDIDLIPTHSHLMAAWVEGGIGGAMFWAYLSILIVRGLLLTSQAAPILTPVYIYNFVSLGWAILFSPPGGVTILPEAFTVIIACQLLESGQCISRRAVSTGE